MTKSFLGIRVLHSVSLDLAPGEVHAVVGENGAGKSTLMKLLSGEHTPDGGRIEIDGTPHAFGHPAQAQAAGIGIIHQELALLPDRTVAENVFLGREPTRRGLVDRAAMARRAAELLAELDAREIAPDTPVRELSVARQQTVEVAKALAADVRILIMDEPTAALAEHEVNALFALVRRLTSRGLGILYVSHRMREIFELSQRITVLKDGRRVTCVATAETDVDGIVRAMVGRELSAYYPPRARPDALGEPVLTVAGGGNDRLADIDLTVRAGEVLGVAGLQGSGRSALVRAVFGADPFTRGRMTVAGREVRPRRPREAIRAGIALVGEDRKAEGLTLRQSVRDNTLLVTRAVGVGERGAGESTVARLLDRVRLTSRATGQEVRFLSGGNQQKVVIAKWLAARPRVLLFDEPTRGVDVGAKAAIHTLVRELAAEGLAVLLISSELPELIGMSDRVLVLADGRPAGELPAGPSEEDIMRMATATGADRTGTEAPRPGTGTGAPRPGGDAGAPGTGTHGAAPGTGAGPTETGAAR